MTKTHRIKIEEAENGYTLKVYSGAANEPYINTLEKTFVFHKPHDVGTYIGLMLAGENNADSERLLDGFFALHGVG